MGVFVLVSTSVPPAPPAPIVENPWPGSVVTWTGWDGSRWDLNAATSGVALLPGVRGYGPPPVTLHWNSSPAVAGAQYLGESVTERPVFWPLAVWKNTSSGDWVKHDSAFFNTIRSDRPGVWSYQQPSGETRRLRIRYSDDGNTAFDTDPTRYGIQIYGLEFVADQPYWEGDVIFRRFESAAPAPFFSGPIVTISSGKSFATATITNPGEVDAPLLWTVIGPSTSATVGVGDGTIEVPFTVAAGEAAQIDTSPTAQTCMLGAWDPVTRTLSSEVDVTKQLGDADFDPVPPGADQPLAITMTGTGVVEVELTPLYKRAW